MIPVDPIIVISGALLAGGTAARFILKDAIAVVILYKQLRFAAEYDHQLWWELEASSHPAPKKVRARRAVRKSMRRLEAVKRTDSKGGSGRSSPKSA